MARKPISIPAQDDLRLFITAYRQLDIFDAHCRVSRGMSAFPADMEIPNPAVMRVLYWLESLCKP